VKPWARVVVVLVALSTIAIVLFFPNHRARDEAERTRRSLRQQGFKVDLNEFDLSMPSGLGSNNELLMLAADASRNMFSRGMFSFRRLDLMKPVSSNSAVVLSRQDNPEDGIIDNYFWPELRKTVTDYGSMLDRASEAVISTPFRFKTVLGTNGELAPDIFRARLLASAMAGRAIFELHEQHRALAWTNLLALTRLVTAWQTEPLEISHFTRFRWVSTAQRVTWEALQAMEWNEDELALLQHEWESPNFFSGLAETAALARAGTIEYCRFKRKEAPPSGLTLREFISELVNSPNRAWSDATSGWRAARYRNNDSYEDEVTWLLYFRDCELDYRRAQLAGAWSELRTLSSATNSQPPQVTNSPMGLEAVRTAEGFRMGSGTGGFRQGQTLLARAAEAEARRRLLVTAIALERFHIANHRYPDSLEKLSPAFVKSIPMDFMDGQPLRYYRTDDGRFLLYSIGLDGIDDHGQLLVEGRNQGGPGFGRPEGPDIVWPLAASSAEVRAYARAVQGSLRPTAPGSLPAQANQFRRSFRNSREPGTNVFNAQSLSPKSAL